MTYHPSQGDMFAEGQALNGTVLNEHARAYRDMYRDMPDSVRRRCAHILAEPELGEVWDARTIDLYRAIFPRMTNWLPQEEADGLRNAFAALLERITGAPPPPFPPWTDAMAAIPADRRPD